MVWTIEAFSHVCSHYRMALFLCVANYASKASLSVTTRKLIIDMRFCDEKTCLL